MMIPFNKPYMVGTELEYISQAHRGARLSGDGQFTQRCSAWLERELGVPRALLTHSCTGALEMTALVTDMKPGDEVVMPSFTFVSTANAFALRGAVPVFVDVRRDTLNIDERCIEAAITPRTRAIVVVHYAGVACDMDAIAAIARRHDLVVIEDAAQGLGATYRGRALGAIGDFGTLSFHETKNVICGEGGALLVNDAGLVDACEIAREKGTDRSLYFRGMVDKYTWRALGSSYLPGEITAAFLLAQLERADWLTRQRVAMWNAYHQRLAPLEERGLLRRPYIPEGCGHNGHMYYVLLPDMETRTFLIQQLARDGAQAVFHYIPLHSSPGGRRFGRTSGSLDVTDAVSDTLVRLPLWIGLTDSQIDLITESIERALTARG